MIDGVVAYYEGLTGPGTHERLSFQHKELYLVAFAGERSAVIRTARQQVVGSAPVCTGAGEAFGEEAPLVNAQGLYPQRELAERRP